MTIIVGVLCSDGVIVASDTMLSSINLGFNNQKIYPINNKFVCGIAGSDSLGKMLVHKLQYEFSKDQYDQHDPYHLSACISNSIISQSVAQNPSSLGNINQMVCNGQTPNWLVIESIIGFYSKNEFHLMVIHNLFHPPTIVKITDRLFCQIKGSGYHTSAPLVSLLFIILMFYHGQFKGLSLIKPKNFALVSIANSDTRKYLAIASTG